MISTTVSQTGTNRLSSTKIRKKKAKIFALLAVLLGVAAYGQAAALAAITSGQEPPLRLSEPTDVIIADLESYIPDYMQEKNIPGSNEE